MNGSKVKNAVVRVARRAAFMCLIFFAGFITAIYWVVSPGPEAANASNGGQHGPYPSGAVSISRVAHKSVAMAQAAGEKAVQFVDRKTDNKEQPAKADGQTR